MRSIAILAFLALLITPCIAISDSVTTGPYKVSFDLGLKHSDYNVTVPSPTETEQLSGDKEIDYEILIRNYTGRLRGLSITVKHFEKALPLATGSDWKKSLDSLNKNDPRVYGYKSDLRTIDGADGAILNADIAMDSENIINSYQAVYQPVFDTTHTVVEIMSFYPWDEGTLQLLKTIHVEKINATI